MIAFSSPLLILLVAGARAASPLRRGRALVVEGDGISCPDSFVLNPKETNKDTFLRQFKPCGYYKTHCQHKFEDWFDHADILGIEANVCYPGRGEHDLRKGVHLVQFDIGLDEETYHANPEDSLIDDVDTTGNYLDISNSDGETGNPIWTSGEKSMELGESCVETFAETNDHWGKIPGEQHTANYNCMGKCGAGCQGLGIAKDCMKHDVCSYFKGLALDKEAVGFCRDFDCGDEAMQTVLNCWMRKRFRDKQVICDEDEDDSNPNFYSLFNPAAKLQKQKRACTLRTGWDRNQGAPSQESEDLENALFVTPKL